MWFAIAATMVLTLCSAAAADTPASPAHLELQRTATQILGGQLELALPSAMELEAVEHSISANVVPLWRDELKGSFEFDGVRFTMLAFETYASMGSNFRASVISDLPTQGVDVKRAKIKKLALAERLVGFEVVPKLPKTSPDSQVLIYAVYVGRPDRTVQVLAFYISSDALSYSLAWTSLARRMVMSLAPGRRHNDLEAGESVFARHFAVTRPAGWATSSQLGTGSGPIAVFKLRKVAPLASSSSTSCALELGGQINAGSKTQGGISSNLLGVQVQWFESEDSNGATTTTSIDKAWRSFALVIVCSAPKREQLVQLREMIGTLRLIGD